MGLKGNEKLLTIARAIKKRLLVFFKINVAKKEG